jgi:hypothetical protein
MSDRWAGSLAMIVMASMLLLMGCQDPRSAASTSLTPIPGLPRATTPSTVAEEASVPTTPAEVARIGPEELKDRFDHGEKVTVVDARSRVSYVQRHIPRALSIPLSEIEEHLDELPQSGDIVFYCT